MALAPRCCICPSSSQCVGGLLRRTDAILVGHRLRHDPPRRVHVRAPHHIRRHRQGHGSLYEGDVHLHARGVHSPALARGRSLAGAAAAATRETTQQTVAAHQPRLGGEKLPGSGEEPLTLLAVAQVPERPACWHQGPAAREQHGYWSSSHCAFQQRLAIHEPHRPFGVKQLRALLRLQRRDDLVSGRRSGEPGGSELAAPVQLGRHLVAGDPQPAGPDRQHGGRPARLGLLV
mmetsp:Transcript_30493/g.87977  ORF Transcript_30493/g.87977 Transcript_30493/m.87977 type:complete len:233 (-) Transcript_30493:922-1620(-)